MAYGYNNAELASAVDSFEKSSAHFMNLVREIESVTALAVPAWEADSVVDYKANLDNYTANADNLQKCVDAIRDWAEEYKIGMDTLDQKESEEWQINGGY